MARWLVVWLALVSACTRSPIDGRPPAAPAAPEASGAKAPGSVTPVHAPNALVAHQLSATALLPCASCGSFHDRREVGIRLSLSDDRPANIQLWFEHGWVGGVGITLEYFPAYGFMVTSVSQSGATQGPSRGLSITDWHRSVYPIEGRILASSSSSNTTVNRQGETWLDERAIPPRWIAAETADYRRLLDLFSHDRAHQPLPLNPAHSLDSY